MAPLNKMAGKKGMEKNKTQLGLRGLLAIEYPWSDFFEAKDWEVFAALCSDWQLESLLFFRLRDGYSSCPKDLWMRLRNRFDSAFAHWGRLKAEVLKVSQQLCLRNIAFGFLKGYPLALCAYPHPASRRMQDVDLWVDFERLTEMREIFRELGYFGMPDQSRLEKKPEFVKLHGSHVFAFEFHRSLHTSYQHKITPWMECAFDRNGFPKPEILFVSVLLHHKFFESALRDLVDLHFLTHKSLDWDWDWIEKYCREESLQKHLHRMAHLAKTLLHSAWPQCLKPMRFEGIPCVLKIKEQTLFRKKNRGLWDKLCDAIAVFFVYDRFFVGFSVFWNKYVRHVKFLKFFKTGFKKR
jgi:hypothetical protein